MFGSICYKHIPDARKRKFDEKSEPMILVGYYKTGAYRLLNPINDKIMMSRDIVIDENLAQDWNSGDAINKPLLSNEFNEETDEVKVEEIADIQIKVQAVVGIPDTIEVEEGVFRKRQKAQRTRVRPSRLQDYEVIGDDDVTPDGELVHFALLAGFEPINYSEALENKQWKSAMVEELQAIERNNTWDLVKFLAHTKAIEVKWVFKLKHNPDGLITRYKARLVAHRFLQRAGVDYSEVFAQITRLETIRLVVALA